MRFFLAPLAHRVANSGRFHFDNLGAQVTHQLATERASKQCSQFDNPQTGQWASGLITVIGHFRYSHPSVLLGSGFFGITSAGKTGSQKVKVHTI
jgi:hypothetical protein